MDVTVQMLIHFIAVLWTGQGNFLTINSDSESISRNSGIFWALLQTRYVSTNTLSAKQRTFYFVLLLFLLFFIETRTWHLSKSSA